jgi:hypothetical protein
MDATVRMPWWIPDPLPQNRRTAGFRQMEPLCSHWVRTIKPDVRSPTSLVRWGAGPLGGYGRWVAVDGGGFLGKGLEQHTPTPVGIDGVDRLVSSFSSFTPTPVLG